MSGQQFKKKKPRRDQNTTVRKNPDRPAVLSVDQFAHRKGITKGLQGYKDRKEKKRVETAKALRSYQKVMKREGYEAGTGASRKRKAAENDATTSSSRSNRPEQSASAKFTKAAATNSDTDPTTAIDESQKKKTHRTNRFQKSVQQSQNRQQQQEQFRQQAQEREEQKQQAQKRRRQRHKLLTARTSKGQPVMKNIVQDILTKLQHEQQQKGNETNDKE